MKHSVKNSVREFIWQQGFAVGSFDYRYMANHFSNDMHCGAQGSHQSLAMLPSYLGNQVSPDKKKLNQHKVIAIDAGGSHLRIALASMSHQQLIQLENIQQKKMPGADSACTKDEFFEMLVCYIEPYLKQSDTIGFCFSYPCEISSTLDGRLIRWTKEIQVSGVEQTWIGSTLNQYFEKHGYTKKKIILLNDTVACLLAHTNIKPHSVQAGLILGTGTNCAFRSHKLNDIINIESGTYSGAPDNLADNRLHEKCLDKNHYNFEKKISGRYLGALYLELLKIACEKNIFHSTTQSAIEKYYKDAQTFTSKQLHDCLTQTLFPFEIDATDVENLIFLADCVTERAAYLCATQLYAVYSYEKESYQGKVEYFEINVEGSTYFELYELKEKIQFYLNLFLKNEAVSINFHKYENASLLGAAAAAFSQ